MNLSKKYFLRLSIFAVFLIAIYLVFSDEILTDDNVKILVKQAESGNTDAQFRLVTSYGQGIGVWKNRTKAKYWFHQVAENGHAEAQYWMGYKYYYGEGVEKDLDKALEWYERSANQDYTPAQFMAGYVHQMGKLIGGNLEPDFSKSLYWYQIAATKGDNAAQFHLGCFKYFGIGVRKDGTEAETLIRTAANKGHKGAENFLQDKAAGKENSLQISCDIYVTPRQPVPP